MAVLCWVFVSIALKLMDLFFVLLGVYRHLAIGVQVRLCLEADRLLLIRLDEV